MDMPTDIVAKGETARTYPLNCWWVAATATEVTRLPLERWLLERPVVLYRNEAGEPVALDNRCIHRSAPLSAGHLDGDELVCRYHGARYATDGRCVKYPTQNAVPKSAAVRSYPVIERGPFVWIWMGDDARRTAADLPPEFGWALDPEWTVILNGFPLEANYMLLHENVLDLTHFNHLHKDSFKITDRKPPKYRTEGNKVYFKSTLEVSEMDDHTRGVLQLQDPWALRQEEEGGFISPAAHMMTSVTKRMPNSTIPETITMSVNHLLTPENDSRSHYWWLVGANPAVPPEFAEQWKAGISEGYHEDKAMLSSIQQMHDRDPRGRAFPEFSFAGDGGGIEARRALARILADD